MELTNDISYLSIINLHDSSEIFSENFGNINESEKSQIILYVIQKINEEKFDKNSDFKEYIFKSIMCSVLLSESEFCIISLSNSSYKNSQIQYMLRELRNYFLVVSNSFNTNSFSLTKEDATKIKEIINKFKSKEAIVSHGTVHQPFIFSKDYDNNFKNSLVCDSLNFSSRFYNAINLSQYKESFLSLRSNDRLRLGAKTKGKIILICTTLFIIFLVLYHLTL